MTVKHNRRWSKDAEALEHRLIIVVVGGDISAQQRQGRQRGTHLRIREGVAFHFLARRAPVRVEIEHYCAARGRRSADRAVEFGDIGDARELHLGCRSGRWHR